MKFFRSKNSIKPGLKENSHSKPIPTNQNFVSVHDLSSIAEPEKPFTITSIKRKYMLQMLLKKFKYLCPPRSIPQGINEDWEQDPDSSESEQKLFSWHFFQTELNYRFTFWKIFQIIQALAIVLLYWMASIEMVFLYNFSQSEGNSLFPFSLKLVSFLAILVNIFAKELLIKLVKGQKIQEMKQGTKSAQQAEKIEEEAWYQYDFFENLKGNIYGIASGIYLFMSLLGNDTSRYCIQVVIVLILFIKTWDLNSNIESITTWFDSKNKKNQLRILKLFMLVLAISHIFALILYSLTYIYPQSNWLTAVSISVPFTGWHVHYVYSMYFAITTMVTVGYGDITPKQYFQLIIVCFIQLIGTAFFGYMINVIGLAVVEINKKREEFEDYLSTINKLQTHYQLSTELCQKFKTEINNYQSLMSVTPLNQKQQTKLFTKIQPSVKESFILETNIRVIKKSIFFLTHFTVNFQNEIALKLIRKIYNKNEMIKIVEEDTFNGEAQKDGEQNDKERYMAIINSGSVDIEINIHNNNTTTKKYLKTIQPVEGKPTLNVFGYSAMILNKDIDLQATNQQLSTVYLLKKKDLNEIMSKNMLDFEGIAEIREKMLRFRNINEIEAPNLGEVERHFIPNILLLSKKSKAIVQPRLVNYSRTNRRTKLKLITMRNYLNRTMICIDLQEEQIDKNNSKTSKIIVGEGDRKNDEKGEDSQLDFDQYKNYENFMKRSNITEILKKYDQYTRKTRKFRREKTHLESAGNKFKKYSFSEGINNFKGITFRPGRFSYLSDDIAERHDQ